MSIKAYRLLLATLRMAEYDGSQCTRLTCLATDGICHRGFSAVIPPVDLTDTCEREEAYHTLCEIIAERTSRFGIFLDMPRDTLDKRIVY